VELDPDLSDAHTVLGEILHDYEWKWHDAEAEYRRAIQLNPSDAMAHHHLAHLLAQQGRFDAARAEARLAVERAPATLPIVMSEGVIEYFARRYPESLSLLDAARELDSTSVQLHRARAGALIGLGREREAVEELARSFEAAGQAPVAAGFRARYAQAGRAGACDWLARQLIGARQAGMYVPSEHIAELLAQTGRKDEALTWLERASLEHDTELNRLAVDPVFDPLRPEPRFTALLARVGLPDLGPHDGR
jgi:serine/threonine-protein kinase